LNINNAAKPLAEVDIVEAAGRCKGVVVNIDESDV
jgi:hypothetical protein